MVQLLVGAVFVFLHTRHLSEEAYRRISNAFVTLDDELSGTYTRMKSNVQTLSNQRDLVSSLSMISTYQDVDNYRPLVFDIEKEQLSQELLKAAKVSGAALISIYTPDQELVAFAGRTSSGEYRAGIRSYKFGDAVLKFTGGNGLDETQHRKISALLDVLPYHEHFENSFIDFHQWEQGIYIEAADRIKRFYPDGSSTIIGSVWVREHLDTTFAERISRSTGQDFSLVTSNGLVIGNLVPGRDVLSQTDQDKVGGLLADAYEKIETVDTFMGAKSVQVVGGGGLHFIFGAAKSILWTGVRDFLFAALLVLTVGSLLIIPVAIWFMNKSVIQPLSNFVDSVELMRDGTFNRIPSTKKQDEIEEMVDAYNAMVDALKQREEALLVAKEGAETANRSKSMFLANMSHELRTPLNSIIGFAEMMEYEIKGPLPETYREYTGLVIKSGRMLLETVNSILDVAKIESGKFELDCTDVHMGDIVDEATRVIQPQAQEKQVEIINDTHDMHSLYVDKVRIKQLFMNLLGNAVKFTDQGSVRIFNHCDDTGHKISIEDTGIGMSEEQIELALKPFEQVYGNALARRYQGTGLGLTLSKSIMELHGGSLTITSKPNQGTRVTLWFPEDRASKSAP